MQLCLKKCQTSAACSNSFRYPPVHSDVPDFVLMGASLPLAPHCHWRYSVRFGAIRESQKRYLALSKFR